MSPYQKGGSGPYYVRVRALDGRRRTLSAGTDHARTAKAVGAWVADLRRRHDPHNLLGAILDGEISLAEAHQRGEAGARSELARRREAGKDIDTATHLAGWLDWCRKRGRAAATADTYARQVRRILGPTPWRRSTWTPPTVAARLDALPYSGSTINRHRAALSSFARYLVRVGVLETNPVREVDGAAENPARIVWYPMADAERLIAALPALAQGYEALMCGAGLSTQEVQRLRVRDVDLGRREVRCHGSKTPHRNRVSRILDHFAWTVPYVAQAVRGKLPNALVWPGYHRGTAGRHHRATVAALGLPASTLHDWRHTHAVLSLKAGESLSVVAAQLGLGGPALVARVYGKHVPDIRDYRTFTEGATSRATDDGRVRSGAVGHSGGRPL